MYVPQRLEKEPEVAQFDKPSIWNVSNEDLLKAWVARQRKEGH